MIEASKMGLNMIEPSICKSGELRDLSKWKLIGFNFSMLHFSFHPSIPRFPRSKYVNVDRITKNDYVGIRITRQFLGYGIWDGSLSVSLSLSVPLSSMLLTKTQSFNLQTKLPHQPGGRPAVDRGISFHSSHE